MLDQIVGKMLEMSLPSAMWPVILGGPFLLRGVYKAWTDYTTKSPGERDVAAVAGWLLTALIVAVFVIVTTNRHSTRCEAYLWEDFLGNKHAPAFGTPERAAWDELECDKLAVRPSTFP